MALWSGVEVWGAGSHSALPLAGGLILVTVGAVVLGRSTVVARVAGDESPAVGNRHRLGACAPDGPRRADTLPA